MSASLERLGLLSVIDQASLAAYCESYSTFRKASMVIQKQGMTYEHNGLIKKRPEVSIAADAKKQMRMFAEAFGMTPSSRSRVNATPLTPTLPGVPTPEEEARRQEASPHAKFFDNVVPITPGR